MVAVFWVIPLVFLILGVGFFVVLTKGVPQIKGFEVNLGALRTKDFAKIPQQYRLPLRKKVVTFFALATVATGGAGAWAFSVGGANSGLLTLLLWVLVQFCVGYGCLIPLMQAAAAAKNDTKH